MTNAMLPDSPVGIEDHSGPSGAPEHEIEITPKMIEAGALALMSFDSRYESDEQGAMAVFEAMIAAS